jgi:hypothetical protein
MAWVAIAAGAWYVVGPLVAPLWRADYLGAPVGNRTDAAVEAIGMLYGLGAAIILLASLAAGRFSVLAARDVVQPATAVAPAPAPATLDDADTGAPAAGEPADTQQGYGILHRRRRFAHH